MKERILLKGEFTKKNTLALGCVIVATLSFIVSMCICGLNYYDTDFEDWLLTATSFDCPEGVGVAFYLGIVAFLAGIFFWFQMSYCELTITDKRVYGKSAFGKTMDLPIDEISSLGTCFPEGVFAATSSGIVRFWLLTNKNEVYSTISDLLRERQNEKGTNPQNNCTDELKNYKDLLDSGVITQEEFDAKKKQLLGL